MLGGCGGGGAPTPPPTLSSIAINPNPIYIGQGTNLSLKATGNYSNGTTSNLTSQVTWVSADPSKASVASNGVLTAVALSGASTTITAALNGVTSPVVTISITTAGSISSNGLITARYDHTATLLNDGTVLVAGGYGASSNALNTAEIYDPVTTLWTPAGNMGVARRDHTATLLANGNVVQIGGGGDAAANDLNSVEIYTPSGTAGTAGTWATYLSILSTPRSYHTATLLLGGKILVVGGGGLTNTNELYDPSSPLTVAAVPPTANDISSTGRYSHTATLLQDGRVLITGGFANSVIGAGSVLASAELCDATGTTMTPTTSLATGRYLHTATLLNDGRVLVVGGIDSTGHEVASAELFDPASQTWMAAASLSTARFGHIATLMPNGQVLVMGGSNASNPSLSSAELYIPVAGAAGSWSPTANLQMGRVVFTATLLANGLGPNNGKVLVAGGDGGAAGILSSVELHN